MKHQKQPFVVILRNSCYKNLHKIHRKYTFNNFLFSKVPIVGLQIEMKLVRLYISEILSKKHKQLFKG